MSMAHYVTFLLVVSQSASVGSKPQPCLKGGISGPEIITLLLFVVGDCIYITSHTNKVLGALYGQILKFYTNQWDTHTCFFNFIALFVLLLYFSDSSC